MTASSLPPDVPDFPAPSPAAAALPEDGPLPQGLTRDDLVRALDRLAPGCGLTVEERLLGFWFGQPGGPDTAVFKPWWFERNDALDATLIALFSQDAGAAAAGRLDDLIDSPRGALTLVLLLDQIPRNIWRGHAKAFAADARAREVATDILRRGYDRGYTEVERLFAYLPFEHSEDLTDQDRSLALFERLGNPVYYDYALRHHAIIARFGRFPHRNAALGRQTTPEEAVFLTQPGSSF